MNATRKMPVVQYDGTNAAAVIDALSAYYGHEERTDAQGGPILAVADPWGNETIVTPSMFCCDREIFPDEASLRAAYYILPETP